MLCLLIAAIPTPTRPDYDGAYPRYSKQEIRRAIAWSARSITLTPPCCALSSKPRSDFRQACRVSQGSGRLDAADASYRGQIACERLYDSIQNIRGGAKQLRHLLNLYQGDLPLALAAYNAGSIASRPQVPRIRETRGLRQEECFSTMSFFVLPHNLFPSMKRIERGAD
jgi:hypothetical protein